MVRIVCLRLKCENRGLWQLETWESTFAVLARLQDSLKLLSSLKRQTFFRFYYFHPLLKPIQETQPT